MKKKAIFGTLVIGVLLLGAITPLVAADEKSPGREGYWVVTSWDMGFEYAHEKDCLIEEPNDDYNPQGCQESIRCIWYWDENGSSAPMPVWFWGYHQSGVKFNVTVTTDGNDHVLDMWYYADGSDFKEHIYYTVYMGDYFDTDNDNVFDIILQCDNETKPKWEEYGLDPNGGDYWSVTLGALTQTDIIISYYDPS